MTNKPGKLVPALVGGVVLAALSIIPFINFGCCVWGIAGGAVAAYMLVRRSPVQRVTTGDGALAGALAGLIGSVIFFIPILLTNWLDVIEKIKEQAKTQADPKAQDMMNQIAAFIETNRPLTMLLTWLLFALVSVGLATLGGIIGVAIFEKRKGSAPAAYPPPSEYPPPGYGPPPDQPPY